MSTRNRGKRLASGITAAVGAGSLATAGVAAAAIYSATPAVLSKANSTTSTSQAPDGPSSSGSSSGGYSGSTPDNGVRRQRGYGGVSPVQPGNGGFTHGQSSGS